jgi:hypothetical protein
MACLVIKGLIKDCKGLAVGGVKNVYLTEFANVLSFATASGIVSAITMVSTKKFSKFELWVKTTNSFNLGTLADTANGSVVYTQSLDVQFPALSQEKNDILRAIEQQSVIAIVESKSGKFFMLGSEFGLDAVSGDANSGAVMTDFNGYTLKLDGMSTYRGIEVLSTVISTIV